jgi:hypothetical protein
VSGEISPTLRRELAEVTVSQLAEYLCERLQLDEGEKTLQIAFKHGRYNRMKMFAPVRRGYPSSGV